MTTPHPGDRSVDRAALLGTSLAAVVALTFGGRGPWEWLASVVGLALLAVLLGFFRLHGDEPAPRRERLALSAVAALCATLVVAAPLQVLVAVTPAGAVCADLGTAAAAGVRVDLPPAVVRSVTADAAATAYDDCLGVAVNRWLWLPALAFVAIFQTATTVLTRRWWAA